MSEDSGADVISDLEEGEIPDFEVTSAFIRKDDLYIQSKEEKSVRVPDVENQWKFKKDQSMHSNSLYTRRSPKSSAKNNIIDYKNESLTQFDSPSSEGECTSEEDRTVYGNDKFQKYLFSKELNENRSKYLYPFQTTYGTVEDIMTKIDKTLAKNNNCYYKRRRSKESKYNLDLTNNRAKNSSLKDSSPIYLNKFRNNYCKRRRYSENNYDSDSKIWEKKDKTKNFNLINGNKKGKDIKNKKKRDYDVILENKNNIDNAKKFKSFKKHEKDFIDYRKKELDILKTRSSSKISRPYEDIPLPQEPPPAERDNFKSQSASNSNTNHVVSSSISKDLSNSSNEPHDIISNNNSSISDKSDKISEQFSGDDEDIELIKLRLIALTSNKKKNQSLMNDSNENQINIKSDLEQEISEFVCEYKITDEPDAEGNLASDANSASYKTSYNTDIDRSELLLRAEALKTALMKKHKHRIKKHKNSSHFTNACGVLVEKNLENSGQSESDIRSLNEPEELIQQKQDIKTDFVDHINALPCNTKDIANEATLNNPLNKSSEKNESVFKFNSLKAPEIIINEDILKNEKSVNISCAITEDSVSEAFSGANFNINNISNTTNDNNSKFSGACSSSDSSSSNSNNYKINYNNNNNNNNCNNNINNINNNNKNNIDNYNNNNNNNNTFKENKLLRKQFKKKRWKNNKKKTLTFKKSNIKENKNQVNDNHEEDVQKLRTQLLNDLLKKKKIIEDEKKSVLIDKLQTSNIQQAEKIKIKKCKTTVKPQNFQKNKGADKLYGEINATPKPKMPEMELQRIIVYLGSDSSDEEGVLENNSKTEPVLDTNLNKNSENLKEKNIPIKAVENKKEDYEKSVDHLLKEERKRVERKSEVPETQTPEAVFNHLPPSQRLEYMRLKQKIAEREKLKKSKKTIAISKSLSEKNNNPALKNKKIGGESVLVENNECILTQLPNDEAAAVTLDSKLASNTENTLDEKRNKTENEKKSSDKDEKLVLIAGKLCKSECTSNALNTNAKRNTVSSYDKLSNKKACTQSGGIKSSTSECNLKNVKISTSNNETCIAKTLLERKKVLTLNRLHLEKLKILWKNIRVEKFIEQKYEKEIKRLKTQQSFFELKLNQQKSKIKKLAEESKYIYEMFQKNNKGFDLSEKQKLPVKEKSTLNASKSYVVKRNANEKNAETKSDDSGRNPAHTTVKTEGALLSQIEGANQESIIEKNTDKENEKKICTTKVPADELKEYNSPLKTFNNGSEFSDCMRIDPNTIMCHFDLLGKCNDEECNYQHWRANSN